MKKLLFLTLLLSGSAQYIFAQCNTSIDAGPDQTICAPNQVVSLNATTTDDFFEIEWMPLGEIANPNALNTTVLLEETTTFTVTMRSFSDENLIINGDFSDGDQSFTSDYIYGTGGGAGLLSNEGQYAIASNAGSTHTQFANCSDHTGGGNMMVINASGDASNVWCQTVPVDPNTEYAFSAWVTSVVSQNPAQLQFSINGTLLGAPYNASSATCSWNEFYETWESGNNTTAEICIANVNFTPVGNDFALDDISFSPVCIATDEVTITVAELDASWSGPTTLCSNDATVILNDLLDANATTGGTWTLNGMPIDEINPSALPANTYTIQYSVTEASCEESQEATLEIVSAPIADFSLNQSGYCLGENINITFSGSASAGATFNWDLGPLGTFSGPGPFNIEAITAGSFPLTLTVSDNGCTSNPVSGTIQVDEPPFTDLPIDCEPGTDQITFSWPEYDNVSYDVIVLSGQSGAFLGDNEFQVSGLSPNENVVIQLTANFDGIACETASFQANCMSLSCPVYGIEADFPTAVCSGEEINLQYTITGSDGPFDIEYTINGQSFTETNLSAENSIQFTPETTFNFQLISIIDQSNPSCPVDFLPAFTIPVEIPASAGTVAASPAFCESENQTVNLFDLLNDEDANGVWSIVNGSPGSAFDAANGSLDINTIPSGNYTFAYTQTSVVCPENSTEVSVDINPLPTADAGQDLNLSCDANSIVIGGQSSTGAAFSYSWMSPDGGQITNPTVANPEISSGGTFQLTVTNTETGCEATDEIIVIKGSGSLEIFTSLTPIDCNLPSSGIIQIDSVVGGIAPYTYSFEGSDFSDNTLFSNLEAGTYSVMASDESGCVAEVQLTLNAPTELTAQITTNLGNDNVVLPLGEPLKLDLQFSGTPDTVIWNPILESCNGCTTPVVSPLETTTYTVTVIDENGCSVTDAIQILVEQQQRVFIPNVFSPNDDGLNDIFFINAGPEVLQIITIEVMDRWGNQVFSRQNISPNAPMDGWDGEFNGQPLNPGVFVYYIELELQNGQILPLKGEISLLR